MTHVYADIGAYQISATKRTGEVYFGQDKTAQAVMPISALTDVIFSWDVSVTKPYAFYQAVNLPAARLTRFMTRVAEHAFDGCTGLSGSLEIPDSIIYIDDGAFKDCDGIESLKLSSKLSQLGDNAFNGCKKLASITFNAKSPLKTISNYAFYNCTALKTIEFSPEIISISDYAFAGCTGLETVTLPETITNLGSAVFYGDSSLSQVSLLATSMTFHTAVFQNCPQLLTAGPYNTTGDQNYNIAFNWSTTVPAFAFAMTANNEAYLQSITLPINITEIGQSAFYLCTKLVSADLPAALEKLNAQSFYYCLSLTEVTVPKTVTYIGSNAFGQC